jgi:hypothetical protein
VPDPSLNIYDHIRQAFRLAVFSISAHISLTSCCGTEDFLGGGSANRTRDGAAGFLDIKVRIEPLQGMQKLLTPPRILQLYSPAILDCASRATDQTPL